jgi:predicted secreted protein
MSEFSSKAGMRGQSANRTRVALTSGLALAVLTVGAGATWASTTDGTASGGTSVSRPSAGRTTPAAVAPSATKGAVSPVPIVTSPTSNPAGQVDVYGPDNLPTTPVGVKAGDKLVVHLSEQAGSTGYSWSATSVPKNLSVLGNKVVAGTGMPGAVGEHTFTYQVDKARWGSLSFALRRAGSSHAAKRVTIRIIPTVTSRTVDVYGPEKLPTTPVQMRVGDKLVVHLTEQAGSTGYSWAATSTPKNLSVVGDETLPGADMPGAAGEHTFTYQVSKAGTGRLSFSLRRPWESTPATTVTLAVAAQG